MRTLSTFLGTTAVLMGLAGCVSTDPGDLLTTVTSATFTDTQTTDDMDTETGDGDGDATGDGDGDPATGDGDGDATGDGDGDPTGCFNCPCGPNGECDMDLECEPVSMTCQIADEEPPEPMWGDGPYYGDPAMGCQPDEAPLMDGQLPVAGGHCAPIAMCPNDDCTHPMACPPAPEGVTAAGQVAWSDGMGGNYCGLICDLGMDSADCPAGSTCKDLMQMNLGVCTYP